MWAWVTGVYISVGMGQGPGMLVGTSKGARMSMGRYVRYQGSEITRCKNVSNTAKLPGDRSMANELVHQTNTNVHNKRSNTS